MSGPRVVPLWIAMVFGPFLAWKRGVLLAVAQRLTLAFAAAILATLVAYAVTTGGPVMAPLFEKQMAFNGAIVEHLNRNAAAHREAQAALQRALPALRDGFDGLVRFESLLVQFLQTIPPLSDTLYREIPDANTPLPAVHEVAAGAPM